MIKKKSKYLVLALSLAVILLSSCKDKKETSVLTLGETKGQNYKNDFFGIELEIPKDIKVIPYEDIDKANISAGYIKEQQASAGKTGDELSKLDAFTLVRLERLPGDMDKNTTFVITASNLEKLILNTKTNMGSDFDQNTKIDANFWINQMRTRFEITIPAERRTLSEITDVTFGNITFKKLSLTLKPSEAYILVQDIYAAEINGYFVTITTNTNESEVGLPIIQKIISTLKIG